MAQRALQIGGQRRSARFPAAVAGPPVPVLPLRHSIVRPVFGTDLADDRYVKVYVSPMPGGAKIIFAEARRISVEDRASPRTAVFLQHAALALLRRLLDWTAGADPQPEAAGRSMH